MGALGWLAGDETAVASGLLLRYSDVWAEEVRTPHGPSTREYLLLPLVHKSDFHLLS